MTDKTYTQKEVDALIAAERDAVLREAADKANTEQFHDFAAKGAALTIRNQILALIDQPSALDNALAAAKAEGVREAMAAVDQHTFETSGGQKVIDYREFRMTCESLLAADEQN